MWKGGNAVFAGREICERIGTVGLCGRRSGCQDQLLAEIAREHYQCIGRVSLFIPNRTGYRSYRSAENERKVRSPRAADQIDNVTIGGRRPQARRLHKNTLL